MPINNGDIAVYDFDELDQLLRSYAICVHRSQGSEYPYVIAPLVTEASGTAPSDDRGHNRRQNRRHRHQSNPFGF